MTEKEFQDKLGDLISQIDELPADQQDAIRELADQTKNRHEKLRKTVKDLQDSMDYLRLSIKYLVFDLEATKRENRYLRDMLSGAGGQSKPGDNDSPEPS